MLLNPAIIALLGGSLLITAFALYALNPAVRILRGWDVVSGSEGQLVLERKTHLVSAIFSYLLAYEILSLFLFVHTAERIHGLFVGAMCAAGSLAVNGFGYPALTVKAVAVLGCGVWMIVNHADNRSPDYPLILPKYRLLLFLSALIAAEAVLQAGYFMGLKADVITSCCGTLFGAGSAGIGSDLAALPPSLTRIAFYAAVALTLRVGIHVVAKGRGAVAFGLLAGATTLLSLAAVLSFISPYYYELPTHHCPFCLLQEGYHYVGYPMYLSLFAAGIAGVGAGALDALKGHDSLEAVIPRLVKRLCLVSMAGFVVFALLATYPMVFGGFVLSP